MQLYERQLRRYLFRLGGGDPEAAHAFAMRWLVRAGPVLRRWPVQSPPGAARTVFGIRFPNPVGLAAGMDKNGVALSAWPAIGFGFVEIGTVTPCPQTPNDGIRMVRLPADEAIVNRMGFNNDGARAVAARLAAAAPRVPVGVSIGKARDTPLARAVDDYATALRTLYPHGSYFVVNVSSPNTVALASLQERAHLHELLGAVRTEIDTLHRTSGGGSARKPFLVKVSPDLTDTALGELLEVCAEHHVDGLVATNTTTSRAGLTSRLEAAIPTAGGLSGAPLADRVRQVVAFIHREAGDRMPVIGVGGIMSASDGQLLLDAGAALVQLYTGLVYRGPRLVRQLARELGPSTVPPVPKPRNPPECRSDSPAVT